VLTTVDLAEIETVATQMSIQGECHFGQTPQSSRRLKI
jgi:hypothetical protein